MASTGSGGGEISGRPTAVTNSDPLTGSKVKEVNLTTTAPNENGTNLEGRNEYSETSFSTILASLSPLPPLRTVIMKRTGGRSRNGGRGGRKGRPSESGLNLLSPSTSNLEVTPSVGEVGQNSSSRMVHIDHTYAVMSPPQERSRGLERGETQGNPTAVPNLDFILGEKVEETDLTPTGQIENGRNLEVGDGNSGTRSSTVAQVSASILPSGSGLNLPSSSNANLEVMATLGEPTPETGKIEPSKVSSGMAAEKTRQRPIARTNLDRGTSQLVNQIVQSDNIRAINQAILGEVQEIDMTSTTTSQIGRNLEGRGSNSTTSSSTEAQTSASSLHCGSGLNLPTATIVNEPAPGPSSRTLHICRSCASSFTQRVTSCCRDWFNDEQLAQHGIRATCQRVVDKIFADNNERYGVFMVDAKLWPDDSGSDVKWEMQDNYLWTIFGVAYRTPLILGRLRGWALYVFDLTHYRPKTFNLCYDLEAKYNEQQLVPEVFGRSPGLHGFCDEMISLPGGFSYPKSYIFQPI
ncbi:unnamed protein product [Orchesella dallaii]|uniref:Uncharacterized protein n=1 Tax=Orchesella dallaii TaxID=48710 RepID=A0ABP1QZE8_9HEXA